MYAEEGMYMEMGCGDDDDDGSDGRDDARKTWRAI